MTESAWRIADPGRRGLLHWLAYLGVANFIAFLIVAMLIGGDAANGHEAGGRYFLSNHGKLTEVSRTVFLYSRWHVYSLIVSHPMAMICGLLLSLKRRP